MATSITLAGDARIAALSAQIATTTPALKCAQRKALMAHPGIYIVQASIRQLPLQYTTSSHSVTMLWKTNMQ